MPSIETAIFQKQGTGLPTEITAAISNFCAEISPGYPPRLVDVRPEADAVQSECFNNVRRKIERDGGTIAYGWAIWEWPKVFVEAEHHAVWVDGFEMLDVTPHAPPTAQVLFLRDPARTYDFAGKQRIINIKRSLGIVKSAQAWIDAMHRMQEYVEACSEGGLARMDRSVAEPSTTLLAKPRPTS